MSCRPYLTPFSTLGCAVSYVSHRHLCTLIFLTLTMTRIDGLIILDTNGYVDKARS